ncbi:MAG: hypothetical protein U0P45_07330 [Acidimicrobiales bacterium]
MTAEPDPRIQAGLEAMQRAAKEMIAASRALLDAAEDLVDDPRAAASIVDLLGTVASRAPRMPRPGVGWPAGADDAGWDDDEDDEGEPPVQRIPVS